MPSSKKNTNSSKKRNHQQTPSPGQSGSNSGSGPPRKLPKRRRKTKKASHVVQVPLTDPPNTSPSPSQSPPQSPHHSIASSTDHQITPSHYERELLSSLNDFIRTPHRSKRTTGQSQEEYQTPDNWEDLTEVGETPLHNSTMATQEEIFSWLNPREMPIKDFQATLEKDQITILTYFQGVARSSFRQGIREGLNICFENAKALINLLIQENQELRLQIQTEKNNHLEKENQFLNEKLQAETRHSEHLLQVANQPIVKEKSWSQVAAQPPNPNIARINVKPEHVVIIKQKKENSEVPTERIVKTTIHPLEHQIIPTYVRKAADDKVLFSFKTKQEAMDACAKIHTINNDLEARVADKKNPKIIIKGLPKGTSDESIKRNIIVNYESRIRNTNHIFNTITNRLNITPSQNHPIIPSPASSSQETNNMETNEDPYEKKIVIKFRLKNRTSDQKENAVIELDPQIFKVLIQEERLSFDWYRYRIEIYRNIPQCLRCCRFGHTFRFCKSTQDTICYHCADKAHEGKDCPKKKEPTQAKCANCNLRNEKFKTTLQTNHSATSYTCPIRKEHEDLDIKKTDYGQ